MDGSFEKIRMSSRYTTTQSSKRSLKMSFMRRWKEAGAFVKPKGMTKYSKRP